MWSGNLRIALGNNFEPVGAMIYLFFGIICAVLFYFDAKKIGFERAEGKWGYIFNFFAILFCWFLFLSAYILIERHEAYNKAQNLTDEESPPTFKLLIGAWITLIFTFFFGCWVLLGFQLLFGIFSIAFGWVYGLISFLFGIAGIYWVWSPIYKKWKPPRDAPTSDPICDSLWKQPGSAPTSDPICDSVWRYIGYGYDLRYRFFSDGTWATNSIHPKTEEVLALEGTWVRDQRAAYKLILKQGSVFKTMAMSRDGRSIYDLKNPHLLLTRYSGSYIIPKP